MTASPLRGPQLGVMGFRVWLNYRPTSVWLDRMASIFVARSKSLSDWGASVGISKNLFMVGIADTDGKDAVAAINQEAYGGVSDWRLVKADDAGDLSEAEALERLATREKTVDPKYYPRIKGANGIFRVKLDNVELDSSSRRHLRAKRA